MKSLEHPDTQMLQFLSPHRLSQLFDPESEVRTLCKTAALEVEILWFAPSLLHITTPKGATTLEFDKNHRYPIALRAVSRYIVEILSDKGTRDMVIYDEKVYLIPVARPLISSLEGWNIPGYQIQLQKLVDFEPNPPLVL